MSEFKVEVVKIGEVAKHQNADSLSITMVHGGYPVIFKTGTFSDGDLATYVPVDALVPVEREQFAFLAGDAKNGFARIKARRLRGVFSMGLLVEAPVGASQGDDVQSALGIDKWLPESERDTEPLRLAKGSKKGQSGKVIRHGLWARALYAVRVFLRLETPPIPFGSVYDIEGLRKFKNVLRPGEEVVLTEKVHGCNARFLHTGKRFYVGSRTRFREGPSDWQTIADRLQLKEKLRQYPGITLFGEVYGSVQDLKYGVPASESVRFVAFDAMRIVNGMKRFMDYDELLGFCAAIDVPVVPELYRGEWTTECSVYSEGKSIMPGADHVREGFVVKPVKERHDPHFGRVQLKLAGEGYLTRKGQ